MSKVYRAINSKYIDSSSVMYKRTKLESYLDSLPNAYKISIQGERNCAIYIGKTPVKTTGSGNTGTLEVRCSLPGDYYHAGSITWYVDYNGSIYCKRDYWCSAQVKQAFTYSDGTYIYFFVYIPNYNDNWIIEVVNKAVFTIYNQQLTHDEYNSMISSMTLVDHALGSTHGINFCSMHTNGRVDAAKSQTVLVTNYTRPYSYGSFVADTANAYLRIPAHSCRIFQVGGMICGGGPAFIEVNMRYADGTSITNSNGVLIQAAGNGYWKESLPTMTIPIEDGTQDIYIRLYVEGYNGDFCMNNGFSTTATFIWALGII